eukprot:TRINITY_DN6685_c0_g3_i1.p1 TRINITY_DN6685_c0_g3~~TRINITY_DN6685_c0_g3_i1.p1  ORF type:complete len:101 (-),score=9.42 TRINITY_DN6685_c0_g3_i1:346-612(-)
MAVRSSHRRLGVARKLLEHSELVAKGWGCRAMALHCDVHNSSALQLYLSSDFRIILQPLGARWPQPMPSPGAKLTLMMKHFPPKWSEK